MSIFTRPPQEIKQLAFLAQQDPRAKHWSEVRGSWSNFLNENVTQAVTSVLKLRAGKITRAEAFAPDDFYIYSAELAEMIEQQYKQNSRYKNFEEYFPVLLRDFAKKHPATAAK